MTKISKEKQQQLILVFLGTAMVIAGLWFGVIALQQTKLKQIAAKAKATQEQIDKVQKVVAESAQVNAGLKTSGERLAKIESGMATGDLYSWIVTSIKQFNVPSYKVDMPPTSCSPGLSFLLAFRPLNSSVNAVTSRGFICPPGTCCIMYGVPGATIVHICLGYGHLVRNKPSGYAFLPQLADSVAAQISIEAAQPRLDLGVLQDLSQKTILLGVLDLGDHAIETAETVAERLREGQKHVAPERLVAAPDCGMKYLPREVAFGKLKALAEGAAIVRREISG